MYSGVDPGWPSPDGNRTTDHDEIRRSGPGPRVWLIAAVVGLVLLAVLAVLAGDGLLTDLDPATGGDAAGNGDDPDRERSQGDLGSGGDEFGGPAIPGQDEPVPGGDDFRPDSLDVGAGAVWVSDISCGIVVRINPDTEQVEGAIDIGGSASGVAVAGDLVWIGNRAAEYVVAIDPEAILVEATVEIPGYALGLTEGAGSVWAVDPLNGAVHRIDTSTGTLVESIAVGSEPHYVEADDDSAWVTNHGDGTVSRIDPGTNRVTDEIRTGAGALHVVEGAGSAWVTNSLTDTVSRLDADTGRLEATIDVGSVPHALTYAAGTVWVGTETGQLWRIDPADEQADQVAGATFDSIDMAADGEEVWVADSDGGRVIGFDAVDGRVTAEIELADFGSCQDFRLMAVRPPFAQQVSLPSSIPAAAPNRVAAASRGERGQAPKSMVISSSLMTLSAGGGAIPRSAPTS